MNKVVFSLVAGFASLAVTPASAVPIGNLSGLSNDTVQVAHRMVCDRFGRCYRAAHRNVRRQSVVRDYDYAPSYGYGPRNSYGYAPRDSYGPPSVGLGIGGFGIGVGPRW
jgi:hypothetical protein